MTIFENMDYGTAPETSQAALQWLDQHQRRFGHFIDGKFHTDESEQRFDSRNPADGTVLASLSAAGTDTVNKAVKAAKKAQSDWSALNGHQRARHLYALARLIQKHARLFAVLETLDNGKPIRESRDADIPLVIRHFYHHAGWAQLLDSEMPEQEALGVVGQIIPWNFPLLMLAWKVAPALACGNTVVLKPAEYTSLSALLFAEICQQAGLPKGVVNIITGDGTTGSLICEHPDISKIAFTGSTEVGRQIREKTAGSGKKLTLELGGKSPFIVFDDADLDSAVEGIVDAIWFNQGQVCCAGSRLLVQESIAELLLAKIRARMDTLRIGNPLDKTVDLGAIVDPIQLQQITSLVKKGVEEGAEIYQPQVEKVDICDNGCFYPPTLLSEVEGSAYVAQEEIFGPVLVSMTFRTPAEAVQLANNTRYGLAASIWSENINLCMDIAPKIKAGVAWINCTNQFDAAAGFGGTRESGFGREGGREGLYEYLKPRHLATAKPIKAKTKPGVSAGISTTSTQNRLDRTAKFYIGGKQVRPDSGYSLDVLSPKGELLGHCGEGNRKDIRNAVEAAAKATSWSQASGHNRAQVLYYIAENLSARAEEFAARISEQTGCSTKQAAEEVEVSIQRLFSYGAWADKYDGAVHSVPMRGVALAMHEANGVMAVVCSDQEPLLGFISLIAPAIAMGNRVVAVPSQTHPLSALDFYQILETSDVPAGVINIITGNSNELAKVLAAHYNVDAIWYWGDAEGSTLVENESTASLKRTWVNYGLSRDWLSPTQGEGREFLRQATEVKNIWAPYGE
ncbi:aldehyde dehydrogenase family protein [Motiliproteus sp. MSK22-1]|uniref:aldehyde dehydrogenase family protein n=1 Tax=Motiliproteus sp. MSK22-1 TaxID=1897630 RepID=UPI001E36E618|nr:aldehyde dehydrogenase family protein [Motiliproteus sp. MSK22-1]